MLPRYDRDDYQEVCEEALCRVYGRAKRIRNQSCAFCGVPAEYETDAGYLCGNRHSDNTDGYVNPDRCKAAVRLPFVRAARSV